MGLLFRIILMAVAAFLTARLLPGVTIDSAVTAILVALVLALLNAFLKPILVVLTIPITIITLGLFLLVIDMLIVLLQRGSFRASVWRGGLQRCCSH